MVSMAKPPADAGATQTRPYTSAQTILAREGEFAVCYRCSAADLFDRKIFCPSGNVMSRPLALFDPSRDRKPSTMISVPTGREFRVTPRRNSALGVPASIIQRVTVPLSSVTSM